MKFITVIDATGRSSSLGCPVNGGGLEVIGSLPHQSIIQPASIVDAKNLIDWLTLWIDDNKGRVL